MRHLLQRTDPIPELIIPTQLTMYAFFEEWLLRRGSPQMIKRLEHAHVFSTELAFDQVLNGSTLERVQEITAMSGFTQIRETFTGLQTVSQTALVHADAVFRYALVLGDYPRQIADASGGAMPPHT
jgi:hypothetical protein